MGRGHTARCLWYNWRMRLHPLPDARRTPLNCYSTLSSFFAIPTSRAMSSYTLVYTAHAWNLSVPSASPHILSTFYHNLAYPRFKQFSTSPTEDNQLFEHDGDLGKNRAMVTTSVAQSLLVIQPDFKSGSLLDGPYVPAIDRLEEAVSLAESITEWKVMETSIANIRRVHNRYLFGTGKITELKTEIQSMDISGVFVNVPVLTPVQYRSLKELFGKEIFDRFSIVLQIFKERAKTREAKVQVELAEIPYLRSRLVGEEDEGGGLDQQRGGTGKMGGAGETSVEVARRALQRREKMLKLELSNIREKHRVSRENRAKNSIPIVAVIGYTNAGKTTLIKALSKDASMEPEDMLFATLDTTMHAGKLPCGLKVLFVDTIGFISDLPHELVESFASTLEDATSADVLVHVRDVSHPKSYAQKANVLQVLSRLDLRPHLLEGMIEVLNKADKLTATEKVDQLVEGDDSSAGDSSESSGNDSETTASESDEDLQDREATTDETAGMLVSATKNAGLKELKLRIQDSVLRETKQQFWKVTVPADGPYLSWLHSEATVCDVRPTEVGVATQSSAPQELEVLVVLSEASLGRLRAKHGGSVTISPCSGLNHNYKLL